MNLSSKPQLDDDTGSDTFKALMATRQALADRLARRQRAPAGRIYQIKKHRKVVRLEKALEKLSEAISSGV